MKLLVVKHCNDMPELRFRFSGGLPKYEPEATATAFCHIFPGRP
jgi:hypothetical protein